MTGDTTPGDSVRVILERDFTYGDRLTVVVLDSASQAVLLPVPDGAPDTTELARYNATFAVRATRTAHGYRVALYDVARHHFTHAATFVVATDSAGLPIRWRIHQIADEVQRWITGTRGIAATRIAYVYENQIHLIESDGGNDRQFTTQGVALSPSWHPRGTALVYSDLMDAGTQIGRIDLMKGTVSLFALTPPRSEHHTGLYSTRRQYCLRHRECSRRSSRHRERNGARSRTPFPPAHANRFARYGRAVIQPRRS